MLLDQPLLLEQGETPQLKGIMYFSISSVGLLYLLLVLAASSQSKCSVY